MEQIFNKLTSYLLYTLLCGIVFYYIAAPKIIEHRAISLGLMQYNSDKGGMVAKDSLHLCGWDIYYLQYGNMNGY
jgi:hypothetical protein|tara:strand:+ start:4527 stop:4751 length:225 start_codon:yes stop_codon:yes gene_type:complete